MKSILFLSTLVWLSACSGTMQGMIRGTGEPVQFQYEQGFDSDLYTAVVDGETFQGKAVRDGATTTFGTGFGPEGMVQIMGGSSTNRFIALLFGTNGNSLNCQMRYADSSGLTSVGGIGFCEHSDGRIIDVMW